MALTETETEFEGYERICTWHHRQPFGAEEPYARVVTQEQADFTSWSPKPGNRTPGWLYVSTKRFNTGTFYIQPGGWFDSGNHPGPEPYYILKGSLHLSNPDTGDVVELRAGDASNIPAFAYHHAFNFGDEEAHILWWVPGEMHTDEFKRNVSADPLGDWKWYERTAVTLNGPIERQQGFPCRLDELASWPSSNPKSEQYDMVKLDRPTWMHTLQGTNPRNMMLTSFFYADERIRCGEVRLPENRDGEPERGNYEKVLYVAEGDFVVNLAETAQSLRGKPGDMIFIPPNVTHSYEAIGTGPARALFAIVDAG